jgi:signal transduction histidine kinase
VIPGEIADVEETYLLLTDPLTGEFESVGHWLKQSSVLSAPVWDPSTTCAVCVEKPSSGRTVFHVCQDGEGLSGDYVYCLEVSHQNIPTAVLKFRVHQDAVLSPEEEEIFSSIRDEIIVAIQSSQDRRRLSEMQWAEVAIAERRMVSTYVHDQLGQNLGYLHLKLDQLSNGEGGSVKELRTELNRLREVANESYEIVRDILKKMQPETIPHLTNLLQEHARTVSRRSKFALDFKSIGKPRNLPADIQQTIFFTFREILSNVEKHALANRVDVLIVWEKDTFDISVSDNGRGFDAAAVQNNEHFGLDIMRERISNIMGKLTVQSSQDLGTVVSITIPLGMMKEVSA